MDIKNIAELSKLMDLCRKKGIETVKVTPDSIEFKLKEKSPQVRSRRGSSRADEINETNELDTTPEDILFWSAGGGMLGDNN